MCQFPVMDVNLLHWSHLSLHRLLVTLSVVNVALALPRPLLSSSRRSKDVVATPEFLTDLSVEKLDLFLESYQEKLEEDVFYIYQEELQKQDVALQHINRYRRQALSPIDILTNMLQDSTHTFNFDLGVKNRGGPSKTETKVERLEFVGSTAGVKVSGYAPLYLTDLPALFKDKDAVSYTLQSGTLEVVKVRNEWTANATGCPCGGTGTQDGRSHESCACCVAGNCLCGPLLGYEGNSCVPCGAEPFLCSSAGHKKIEMDDAVGFQYTKSLDELQRIVIILRGETISFYRAVERHFVPVRMWNGINSFSLIDSPTQLGYGEALLDSYGGLKKRRFLFYFTSGQSVQSYQEVIINAWDSSLTISSLQYWVAGGTLMEVSQMGNEVHIIVQEGLHLKIYKLREQLDHQVVIQPFQKLKFTTSLISWKTVTTDFENILLVVTSSQISVYIISNQQYKLAQNLNPSQEIQQFSGAIPIQLHSCAGGAMIVAGYGNQAIFYSYRRAADIFDVVYATKLPYNIANWSNGISFVDPSDRQIKVALIGTSGLSVFGLVTRSYDIPDPLAQHSEVLHSIKEHGKTEYDRQTGIMQRAEQLLGNSIDSSSEITGNITITHSLVVRQMLKTSMLVSDQSSPNVVAGDTSQGRQFLDEISSLKAKLQEGLSALTAIEAKLEDAVLLGKSEIVSGYKTINVPGAHLQKIVTDSITVQLMQADVQLPYHLQYILQQLVRVKDGNKIGGLKAFTGELLVEHLYTHTMDEVAVNDLVTVNSVGTIAGASFSKPCTAVNIALKSNATVGGVDISKALLLIDNLHLGYVSIPRRSLRVEGNLNISSKILSGVDIDNLFANALQLTGGIFPSSLTFVEDLTIQNLEATSMMGINSRHFLNDTIFKNTNGILNGTLTVVDHILCRGNLYTSRLNGNDAFPHRFLVKRTNDQIIFKKPVHFTNVKFSHLNFTAGGSVDGISPNALVTKSTNQDVTGRKIFASGGYFVKDLSPFYPALGGIHVEEILTALIQHPSLTFSDHIIFDKAVQVPQLNYRGSLNKISFSDFASDIVYSDLGSMRINGRKKFAFNLVGLDVQVNRHLNGEDPHTLVITSQDQEVAGLKAFQANVRYNLLTADLIDGVRIDALALSAFYLDKPNQIIHGQKAFVSYSAIDELEVAGAVSKVDFRKVLTYSSDQVFLAPQTFAEATFSEVEVNGINMNDHFLVDGVDLSELYRRRMPLKSSVNHSGTLIISGPLSVIGTLSAVSINNFNIQELQRNLVMDDRNSIIHGEVTVTSLNVGGQVTTSQRAGGNGLNISEIARGAVKIYDTNIFTGSPVLGEMELRGDVTVGRQVNGINLEVLRDDAVSINTPAHQAVTGKKTFLNGFNVKGDINAEKTNSIDLATKLFTRNTDQHISSPFTFANIRTGNIFLLGFYNNINIQKMNELALSKGRVNFLGDAIIYKNVVVKDLEIQNSLNGVRLSERFTAAVKVGEAEKITGRKIFISETRFKEVTTNLLQSVPLNDVLANILPKINRGSLSEQVFVNGLVSAPWISVDYLEVGGTIDGEDYQSLLRNAVYLNQPQVINNYLVFEENIIVSGNIEATLLNGLIPTEDYFMIHVEQLMNTTVTFLDISTHSIDVEGRVNAFQLPKEKSVSMQAVDGQLFTGPRIVTGIVKVKENLEVTGLIGTDARYKLSNEVIDLYETTPEEISGFLRFTAPMTTSHLTSSVGEISGVDIQSLHKQAWYLDEPTVVTARMNFEELAFMEGGLTLHENIDQFNISLIHQQTSLILLTFDNYTDHFKDAYNHMCNQVVTLYELLEDSLYEGECFEPIYHHFFSGYHRASTSFMFLNRTYMVMSYEGRCFSEVFLWNKVSAKLEYYKTLLSTGYVQQWLMIEDSIFNTISLVAVAESSLGKCIQSGTTVWIVTQDDIKLSQILVLGRKVSYEALEVGGLLHVHGPPNTVTYSHSQSTREWTEISQTSGTDFGTSHLSSDGTVVSLWSYGDKGGIRINGIDKTRLPSGQNVLDAVIFDHHRRLHLILYVSINVEDCPKYFLKFYEMSPEGTLHCLDEVLLSAPGKLTSFFVGNDACGSLFVVVTPQKLCPLVFLLRGDELLLWKRMCDPPHTRWIQHFSASTQRFPSILNHYLLLGQSDERAVVVFLVMRGSTVPEKNNKCEVEAFISPRLIEINHPTPATSVAFSPPPFLSSLSELLKNNSEESSPFHFHPKESDSQNPVQSFTYRADIQSYSFTSKSPNTTIFPSLSGVNLNVTSSNLGTIEKPISLDLSPFFGGEEGKSSDSQTSFNSTGHQNPPALFPDTVFSFNSSTTLGKRDFIEASSERSVSEVDQNEVDSVRTDNHTPSNLTEQHAKSVLNVQLPKSVSTQQPLVIGVIDKPTDSDSVDPSPLSNLTKEQLISDMENQHSEVVVTETQHSNVSVIGKQEASLVGFPNVQGELESNVTVMTQKSFEVSTDLSLSEVGKLSTTPLEHQFSVLPSEQFSTEHPNEEHITEAEVFATLKQQTSTSSDLLKQHTSDDIAVVTFSNVSPSDSAKAHSPISVVEDSADITNEEKHLRDSEEKHSTIDSVEEHQSNSVAGEPSTVASVKSFVSVSEPDSHISFTDASDHIVQTIAENFVELKVSHSVPVTESHSVALTEPITVPLTLEHSLPSITEEDSTIASIKDQHIDILGEQKDGLEVQGEEFIVGTTEDQTIQSLIETISVALVEKQVINARVGEDSSSKVVTEFPFIAIATEGKLGVESVHPDITPDILEKPFEVSSLDQHSITHSATEINLNSVELSSSLLETLSVSRFEEHFVTTMSVDDVISSVSLNTGLAEPLHSLISAKHTPSEVSKSINEQPLTESISHSTSKSSEISVASVIDIQGKQHSIFGNAPLGLIIELQVKPTSTSTQPPDSTSVLKSVSSTKLGASELSTEKLQATTSSKSPDTIDEFFTNTETHGLTLTEVTLPLDGFPDISVSQDTSKDEHMHSYESGHDSYRIGYVHDPSQKGTRYFSPSHYGESSYKPYQEESDASQESYPQPHNVKGDIYKDQSVNERLDQYYSYGGQLSHQSPLKKGDSPDPYVGHSPYEEQYPSRYYQDKHYSLEHKYYYPKSYSSTQGRTSWSRAFQSKEGSSVTSAQCAVDVEKFFRPHPKPCNPFRPAKE